MTTEEITPTLQEKIIVKIFLLQEELQKNQQAEGLLLAPAELEAKTSELAFLQEIKIVIDKSRTQLETIWHFIQAKGLMNEYFNFKDEIRV